MLVAAIAEQTAKANERLAQHLWAHRDDLFTFLRQPGLDATKFTEPGGPIRLSAAVEAGQVVLRVRDNGRGIAPEQLPGVFELYYQVPGSGCQATGGLGIGLALVKYLVELHGGSVAASSDGPGTGAEFVVRLPARRP